MSENRHEREAAETAALAQIVSDVVSIRAQIAALQAREARRLADAHAIAVARSARTVSQESREREMPFRSIAAELGAATRESDRTVQRRIDDAAHAVQRFSDVVDAWDAGAIAAGHVRTIITIGSAITDADARRAFTQDVLAYASEETVSRTTAYARRLVERVQPRSLTERHKEARAQRDVFVLEREDGMADLVVTLPLVLAEGCMDRLTRQAKELQRLAPDDTRTLGQIRADLVADMLLTSAPGVEDLVTADGVAPGGLGAIRAIVHVTVPALTLLGANDRGAELAGRSPIDADTARHLAGDATGWDRLLTDPVTGSVLEVDRYTPTAEMKRFLRARDQRCRFPGCRQPAHRSDIDHSQDHALGGPTSTRNLAHLCTRHHTLKHATPWRLRHRADGELEWTSPLGRVYVDVPPPRVVFEPAR